MCYLFFFFLATFNICCLGLIFIKLSNMCLGVFCLGFILFGTLWVVWTWVAISFSIFREVFNYYLLKYFLMAFLFVFFFCDSYDLNVWTFNIVPEVSEVGLISVNSFSLFSSLLHLFPPFYFPPHLSYLLPQLFYCWFPPECFISQLLLIHFYFF